MPPLVARREAAEKAAEEERMLRQRLRDAELSDNMRR